ncbi:MAG: helix-turn-helix transcriptional regulator [Planctomycetota bacterium]
MVDKSNALLIIDAVADRLGVSIRTIHRLRQRGRFVRPVKVGRCTRWRRQDIDEWIAHGGSRDEEGNNE